MVLTIYIGFASVQTSTNLSKSPYFTLCCLATVANLLARSPKVAVHSEPQDKSQVLHKPLKTTCIHRLKYHMPSIADIKTDTLATQWKEPVVC